MGLVVNARWKQKPVKAVSFKNAWNGSIPKKSRGFPACKQEQLPGLRYAKACFSDQGSSSKRG